MDFTNFNPRDQKEEDFLATFVARQNVLEFFLRQLRMLESNQSPTHHLIVAQRGYGKTSLLRRIAISIRTEPELCSRLIAISFREEQHNVISLDAFWRNCLQSLIEVREDENADEEEIEQLDDLWEKHSPRQSLKTVDQDGEPAKQDFLKYCARLHRRPVLLIDNLDALLKGLPNVQQWSLRTELQSSDASVLIAAASRYPESIHKQDSAFYDFFRIQTLDKLDDKEAMRCLRIRALNREEAGKKVLRLIEENPGRAIALNTLSGGNPRTLGVLYLVLESHTNADVLSHLSGMLDTYTGWYHARTEEIPTQSRAVFDALALNWDPMTAAQLSGVTGLATTVVSSQLSRLEKTGYIESVSLHSQKRGRKGFQVSERFFNIWYLMRNGPRRMRQRIKFLAVFLQSCFSTNEQRSIAQTVLANDQTDPGYTLALASNLRDSEMRDQLLAHADAQSLRTGITEEYREAIETLRKATVNRRNDHAGSRATSIPALNEPTDGRSDGSKVTTTTEAPDSYASALYDKAIEMQLDGNFEDAVSTLDELIKHLNDDDTSAVREQLAKALGNKGFILARLDRFEDAIRVYDDLVARFDDDTPGIRTQVAQALFNEGFALGQLDRSKDELRVYEDLVARFRDDDTPGVREQVVKALVNKGITLRQLDRSEDAIRVCDDLVERFGDDDTLFVREQVAKAFVIKGIILGQLDRTEDELRVYEDLVTHFGDDDTPGVRAQVVKALLNKGITLRQLDRTEDELRVYDELVERFGDDSTPGVREQVAAALVIKGSSLGQLGRSEDELRVYDDLVERFGDSNTPGLREQVAISLVFKGITLRQLVRFEDALRVYDNLVERFGDDDSPGVREQVAKAFFHKGVTLEELGRSEDELRAYDNLVARFGDDDSPSLREQVAKALQNKGVTLCELDRFESAIRAYDDLVARFGVDDAPGLREQVARALSNKGLALRESDQSEYAIRVYEELVERYGDDDSPIMREQVARTLFSKGIALSELERSEDELRVYDDLVARFGDDHAQGVREQVAKALFNKGVTLGQLDRTEDELRAYNELIVRFGDERARGLREPVAGALLNTGFALGQFDRSEDELRVYDDLVARFGEEDAPGLRKQVAQALLNKGLALGQLDRSEDELRVYDDLVTRFGQDDAPSTRELVAEALISKGFVLGQLDRSADELRVYDDLVGRFGEDETMSILEQVAEALLRKGATLMQLDRSDDAIQVYDDIVARFQNVDAPRVVSNVSSAYIRKGNLLLDTAGDPASAYRAFTEGLAQGPSENDTPIFYSNCAYVLALHSKDLESAHRYANDALAYKEGLSESGRNLLMTLVELTSSAEINWQPVFKNILAAIECNDDQLWSNYLDDLQRLLWFIIVNDKAKPFRETMESNKIPLKYAPLFHAFVAAVDGKDHLLGINPETRSAAMQIYKGLSLMLKLYPELNMIDFDE